MMPRDNGLRQRGFSLLELSVVLVISAIIGLFLWRWFATVAAPMTKPRIESQLRQAQAAIEGFVLAHHRLPCAATNAAGQEDCLAIGARHLPWRTLGLASDFGVLRYGVNQGGGLDLAAQANLQSMPWSAVSPDLGLDYAEVLELPEPPDVSALDDLPDLPTQLPSAVTGPTEFDLSKVPDFAAAQFRAQLASARVQQAIARAQARRSQVNGLEWCQVLRRYAAATSVPAGALTAGYGSHTVALAYILVHPGSNQQFDGSNRAGAQTAWAFDLPGRAQELDYDDISLAVGPADLLARIGCVERLGQMQAAAQEAYAAFDATRVMLQYWQFRSDDVVSSVADYDSAITGMAMSSMGFVLSTASTLLSIASAANTEGITAPFIAITAANAIMAIVDVQQAIEGLLDAEDSMEASMQKMLASNEYAVHVYDTLWQALEQAIALDEKGLNP